MAGLTDFKEEDDLTIRVKSWKELGKFAKIFLMIALIVVSGLVGWEFGYSRGIKISKKFYGPYIEELKENQMMIIQNPTEIKPDTTKFNISEILSN